MNRAGSHLVDLANQAYRLAIHLDVQGNRDENCQDVPANQEHEGALGLVPQNHHPGNLQRVDVNECRSISLHHLVAPKMIADLPLQAWNRANRHDQAHLGMVRGKPLANLPRPDLARRQRAGESAILQENPHLALRRLLEEVDQTCHVVRVAVCYLTFKLSYFKTQYFGFKKVCIW